MNTVIWIAFALLWIVVVVQGMALLELIRQVAQLRDATRVHVPGTTPVNEGELVGRPFPEASRLAPGATIIALVFLSPTCATCHVIAKLLASFADRFAGVGIVVIGVIEAGTPDAATSFLGRNRVPTRVVHVDTDSTLASRFDLHLTPTVVFVSEGLITDAVVVRHAEELEPLLLREATRISRGEALNAVVGGDHG